MKLVEMKCKNCGALLKVDAEQKDINCQYCHAQYKLDDEVQHIKYDDMEQTGYEFEKGRIRAQQESRNQNQDNSNTNYNKKDNKTLWLVLAWIFLLPFTATYFIAKSTKLDTKKKVIIIAIMWVAFLIMAYSSPNDSNNVSNNTVNTVSNATITEDIGKTNEFAEDDIINQFISSFKEKSSMELNNIEKGNIKTKYFVHINGKYTQLLNATTATAKVFEITINGNNNDESVNEIADIYREVAKILDSSITDEKIQETINTYIIPKDVSREFSLNEQIHVKFFPITELSWGKSDCRIEITTTQYN